MFPAAVSAPTQYGPRVRALGIYLVSYQHLPYARAAGLLSDWIGAPVSTATLAAFVARGAEDLQPFLDEVHAQITAAPVAHFDETGARAEGKLRWLFSASTEHATFYSLHDKRGYDGLNHAGVLPSFPGIAVHDGFKPYRKYEVTHALCNVHHLRELLGIIELAPEDPRQAWAVQMDRLLRGLHATVGNARSAGQDRLPVSELAAWRDRYQQIIALGYETNPAGTIPTGKRGVIRQTPAHNLLVRLDTYREDATAVRQTRAHDPPPPRRHPRRNPTRPQQRTSRRPQQPHPPHQPPQLRIPLSRTPHRPRLPLLLADSHRPTSMIFTTKRCEAPAIEL